jgi:GNAT superfamily N-acetyltransferase
MEITYRKVNLKDPDEMQAIAAIDMTIPALFDPIFEVNEKTISDRLEQLMKCKSDDFFEVALNSDGKIIGYHFMNKFKSPPLGALAADVQTLWVDPAFRKQGIGANLKKRGEQWAKEENLSHISTFVNGKNSSMLNLNQKLGYELVGYKLRKSIK